MPWERKLKFLLYSMYYSYPGFLGFLPSSEKLHVVDVRKKWMLLLKINHLADLVGPVGGFLKKHPYNAPIAQCLKMWSQDYFTDMRRFFLRCLHFANSSPRLLRDLGSPVLLRIICFSARQSAQNLSPGLWAGTEAITNHLTETSAPFSPTSHM